MTIHYKRSIEHFLFFTFKSHNKTFKMDKYFISMYLLSMSLKSKLNKKLIAAINFHRSQSFKFNYAIKTNIWILKQINYRSRITIINVM